MPLKRIRLELARTPEFPVYLWTTVPESHRISAKWIQEANWCQSLEGGIDTSLAAAFAGIREKMSGGPETAAAAAGGAAVDVPTEVPTGASDDAASGAPSEASTQDPSA